MYRTAEDRLGAAAREEEAIRDYGAWRARTRGIAIGVAMIVGLGPVVAAYYAATVIQLDASGYASLKISMLAGAAVWAVMLVIGVVAGKLVVRVRTPHRIEGLAARWEVDRAKIAEVVEMAQRF